MFFCCQQKNNFCQLRIKSGLFFRDLKFKSGLLNKELSYQLNKQGRFTPTPTLPPQGGGSFFNDFNQLIPSPRAGEGHGEGASAIY